VVNGRRARLPDFGRAGRTGALVLACLAVWLTASSSAASTKPRPDDIKKKIEGLSPSEQLQYLTSVRAKGPRDARVSFHLGNAHLALDHPDSAVFYYAEAVSLDSTYTKAHVNLGIALENLNRFDDAKAHYVKAIEIDSTDVLAHCHLGHYYHVRGDIGEAVNQYRRALAADPKSAQAHYNLGLAFADSRLFAEAAREWERVIELSPQSELGRTAVENVRLIKTYLQGGAPPANGE
jgi:tetratricopeptide (TPR) repeat protein